MITKIKKIVESKKKCDIVIIGKGSSIDSIDLSLLKNYIVINTNDSEIIFPGDICIYNQEFTNDYLKINNPECKLYFSNFINHNPDLNHIHLDYIPYSPESSDFLISRFFSNKLYIENSILISALRISNEISKILNIKKNVFLLGFDFSIEKGYTNKIRNASSHYDPLFSEKVISMQENLLEMLFLEKEKLSINIKHVGKKEFSVYTTNAFNHLFNEKIKISKINSHKHKVKIVAEITTNHFGDMDRLKAIILNCKYSGADYVKLQKRNVETFYSQEKLNQSYNSPHGSTFRDYRNGLELNIKQFKWLDNFCKKIGMKWFISVLDLESYQFIKQFEPEMIKLPSTISEHKSFLKLVAKEFKKDIVISTGYTDKDYEKFILNTFINQRKIFLLQCTSSYPTKMEDCQVGTVRHYYNLSKINNKIVPGYSSHDIGDIGSMLSVAAGAKMVEKHVKLGTVNWSHFDEVALDLTTDEFSNFVKSIRKAELIVGEESKNIKKSEHHKYWIS